MSVDMAHNRLFRNSDGLFVIDFNGLFSAEMLVSRSGESGCFLPIPPTLLMGGVAQCSDVARSVGLSGQFFGLSIKIVDRDDDRW